MSKILRSSNRNKPWRSGLPQLVETKCLRCPQTGGLNFSPLLVYNRKRCISALTFQFTLIISAQDSMAWHKLWRMLFPRTYWNVHKEMPSSQSRYGILWQRLKTITSRVGLSVVLVLLLTMQNLSPMRGRLWRLSLKPCFQYLVCGMTTVSNL